VGATETTGFSAKRVPSVVSVEHFSRYPSSGTRDKVHGTKDRSSKLGTFLCAEKPWIRYRPSSLFVWMSSIACRGHTGDPRGLGGRPPRAARGEAAEPPTKIVPSYIESPRPSAASPQTTIVPRCIMNPLM